MGQILDQDVVFQGQEPTPGNSNPVLGAEAGPVPPGHRR